jgi:signal transduction histidine kinase
MKLPSSESFRWYGMVAGLAAVLVLLAVLQYRSVKAVSEATTAQMRASLQGSLMDIRQGLELELTQLCRDLQFGSANGQQEGMPEYIARYDRWQRTAAHPDLVSALFVWRSEGAHSELFKLNASRTAFEQASWPDDLNPLREELVELVPEQTIAGGGAGGHGSPRDLSLGDHRPPPVAHGEGSPGNQERGPDQEETHSYQPHVQLERPRPRPTRRPEEMVSPQLHSRGPFSWRIDQNIPALVHSFREPNSPGPQSEAPGPLDWVVIVLNRRELGQHIVPELVGRYFGRDGQSSYELAVIDNGGQSPDLFTSRPGFDRQKDFLPDAALNLFGPPFPTVAGKESLAAGLFTRGRQVRKAQIVDDDLTDRSPDSRDEGPFRIDPIHQSARERGWEIVAKHRAGSVEAAVAALSRRNLMFNLAVLLVLAVTMGMIIATTIRGRRLAQLQMDFVANVSHELRTPLTGIISAAQNIADGVVDDKQRTGKYGKGIVREAQQLSDLVEQILLFSATQKDRHRYHLQPVDVAEVIDFSLKNTAAFIRSAGITVEQQVEPALPAVSADFKALSHCLQNLIGNAVKYGGNEHWIGIRAFATASSNDGREVRISVADKGIGIGREDLHQIFEPFYRTAEVTATQIHGSGLGLPLARKITEAMGGQLTVESEPGKGSTFTVHLPLK